MTKSIKKDLNKVNKLLHPRSRKARKLHQKANRLVTREKSKKFHAMKENLIGEKLQWFKDRLIPNVRRYTGQMCLDIISTYLSRFDQELEQITIVHTIGKNRKNRRFASREDVINMTILHEKEEFETCGLEVPDLMNAQQLAYLRSWNGGLRFLQNFQLTRYTRKQLEELNDTLLPEDYLPQDDKEEQDVEMEEDESHEDESHEDESHEDESHEDESHENESHEDESHEDETHEDETHDNDTHENEENEDSEWSDVPDESEENKDTSPKSGTVQRKKTVHAHKKLKRGKGKMIVDG